MSALYLPQLATLVDTPPRGKNWVHEAKLDGYRTIAVKDGDKVRIYTRRGHDWTEKYAELANELKKLPVKKAVVDGEIVALNEKGIPDFNKLQNKLDKMSARSKASGLVFYLFDLLAVNDKDITKQPLIDRKKTLKKLFNKKFSELILFSEHFEGDQVEEILEQMCSLGLEGIVSKKIDSHYYPGRNDNWVKTKCVKSDEFIIIGYRRGTHHEFGSLLLGSYEGEELKFAGKIGTGFSKKIKDDLISRFSKIKTAKSPIKEKLEYENIVWVKPVLVAEIEYLERTKEELIRHGSFQRVRVDKDPQEIQFGTSEEQEGSTEREEIHEYYQKMKRLILPHIIDRPLNLYICHGGIHGRCYHLRRSEKENLKGIRTTIKPNGHYLMSIDNEEGLKALVDMGTVEIHVWGTHLRHLEKPDQIVIDLDADIEVSLDQIRECARSVKSLLDELDLESFIKTTGGKGYHIHIPVEPLYSWEAIKSFSEIISKKLALDHPDLYTSSVSPTKRKKKIYIDYLRNSRGATAIAPYAMRARDRKTIAVPISWKDLDKVAPDQFTIYDTAKLLKRRDPWARMKSLKQKIEILES